MPAPPTWPGAHGLGQGVLVDETAARGVDDDHARLGERELVLADEPDGLRGLGQVDGDQVGAGEQLVEREQLDAELRGAGGRDVGVVGDELDAERGEPLRHQLADLAEPDDAHGLAGQLDTGEARALPLALAQARVGGRDVPGGRQQQGDGVLGGAHDVGGGRVDDHHAAGGGRGHVDVVEPHARTGDDLEPAGRRERLGVDLRGRPHEQRIGLGEGREERGAVGAVDVADLHVVAEQRDRGRRELLGEQDDRTGGGGAHKRSQIGGQYVTDRRAVARHDRRGVRVPPADANRCNTARPNGRPRRPVSAARPRVDRLRVPFPDHRGSPSLASSENARRSGAYSHSADIHQLPPIRHAGLCGLAEPDPRRAVRPVERLPRPGLDRSWRALPHQSGPHDRGLHGRLRPDRKRPGSARWTGRISAGDHDDWVRSSWTRRSAAASASFRCSSATRACPPAKRCHRASAALRPAGLRLRDAHFAEDVRTSSPDRARVHHRPRVPRHRRAARRDDRFVELTRLWDERVQRPQASTFDRSSTPSSTCSSRMSPWRTRRWVCLRRHRRRELPSRLPAEGAGEHRIGGHRPRPATAHPRAAPPAVGADEGCVVPRRHRREAEDRECASPRAGAPQRHCDRLRPRRQPEDTAHGYIEDRLDK